MNSTMIPDQIGLKVGVYVDVSNLNMNGGFNMRFDVLRKFACRGGGQAMRLNAYVSYDPERADTDPDYKSRQFRFHAALRDFGYKVIQKDMKWYTDEFGGRVGKANADLDLAVDAILQSENLDRVVLATGDGDFVQVVRTLQNRGCRVEIVAFENVSGDLRAEADLYMSGYLIPNLLPVARENGQARWGELGSFVRGVFNAHDPARGFGWIRYLHTVDGDLWLTDSREPGSPYSNIFCHDGALPASVDPLSLPNRNTLFEFRIAEGNEPGRFKAADVEYIRARI